MSTTQFSANSIRLGLKFDYNNNELVVVDRLNTEYNTVWGFTLTNVKGIIRVFDPTNTLIYANANWNTGSYSSPDIANPTFYKSLGNIPTDSAGNVLQGNYRIEIKLTPNNGSTTYTLTKDIEYSYTPVEVSLNMSVNYPAATLTSVDVTPYAIAGVTPTITRSHKLVAPDGCAYTWGESNPQTTSSISRTIGGSTTTPLALYSGVWQASISSVVNYALQTWDSKTLVEVIDTVTGADSIKVDSNLFTEQLFAAYQAFTRRWLVAAGRIENSPNAAIAASLLPRVVEMGIEYHKLLIARENGLDTGTIYARIKTLLTNEGYSFNPDSSPVMIVPAASSTVGGGGSSFSFSNGTANPTGGNSGDYYYKTDDYTLWYNSSGTWISLGSLKGDTGSTSRTARVLLKDFTPVSLVADSGETLALEKNINLTNLAIADGDIIRFKVGISVDNATPKVSLYHKINNVALNAGAQIDLTPSIATDYTMQLDIVVDTDASSATYPLYQWENEGDKGFGRIHTDIIGQDTLNWKLYQLKADNTAITNARINFVTVELIPYI